MKALLKKLIRRSGYRVIKNEFLNRHFHKNDNPRYRRSGDLNVLEQLFYKYLDNEFFFLQIGANNGVRYDPIHHLLLREKDYVNGIAIEPVEEYFNELKQTYRDFPRIKLIQTAIHNSEKEKIIYKIDPAAGTFPEHFKGMASFDKGNFTKEGLTENQLVKETVPCLSIMELIETEKIEKISLLQIDAEGYDLEIIKSINFQIIRPCIINFEHRWQYNLVEEAELLKVLRSLTDLGYTLVLNGNDALAYLDDKKK